MSLTMKI